MTGKTDGQDHRPADEATETPGDRGLAEWDRPVLTRFNASDATAGTGAGADSGLHLS